MFFHGKRHPVEMGVPEVAAFLTSLAVHDKVAASAQNQALSALIFLYREVLGVELPWLDDVVRAKRPQHLPVVYFAGVDYAGLAAAYPDKAPSFRGTVTERSLPDGKTSTALRRSPFDCTLRMPTSG